MATQHVITLDVSASVGAGASVFVGNCLEKAVAWSIVGGAPDYDIEVSFDNNTWHKIATAIGAGTGYLTSEDASVAPMGSSVIPLTAQYIRIDTDAAATTSVEFIFVGQDH